MTVWDSVQLIHPKQDILDFVLQSSSDFISVHVSIKCKPLVSIPPSLSRCRSSLWEPVQKGSLLRPRQTTGGKHVFQISLCFPLVCFSFPDSQSHRFSRQHRDRKITPSNLFFGARAHLLPGNFSRAGERKRRRGRKKKHEALRS